MKMETVKKWEEKNCAMSRVLLLCVSLSFTGGTA